MRNGNVKKRTRQAGGNTYKDGPMVNGKIKNGRWSITASNVGAEGCKAGELNTHTQGMVAKTKQPK